MDNRSFTNTTDLLSPVTYLATGVYLSFVGFMSTIGNVVVLTVILSSKELRSKPHNILIVNLATADLCVSFLGYPLTAIAGFKGQWDFGETACVVTAFFSFCLSLGSINTLLAICIYRYIIVCKPNIANHLTLTTTRYVLYTLWGHALFCSGLPLLGWGKYGLEPFGTSCSIAWGDREYSNITYIVFTIIACYIVHVSVMVNLYVKIVKTARSLTFGQKDTDRKLNTQANAVWTHKLRADRHVTTMCCAMTTVFLAVWTPYAVVSVAYMIYPDLPLPLTTFPTMFAKAGCMLNPIVYFFTNSNFRGVIIQAFKRPTRVSQDHHKMEGTNEALETHYDQTTKDGIYVGRAKMDVSMDTTVF